MGMNIPSEQNTFALKKFSFRVKTLSSKAKEFSLPKKKPLNKIGLIGNGTSRNLPFNFILFLFLLIRLYGIDIVLKSQDNNDNNSRVNE